MSRVAPIGRMLGAVETHHRLPKRTPRVGMTSRWLTMAVFLLVLTACSNPKHVVVFVDVSGSAQQSWSSFERELDDIQDRLKAGDRFLVATITEHSYTSFKPVVNKDLPAFHFWEDNTRAFDDELAATREDIREEIDSFFRSPNPSAKTDILNTFVLAQKIFVHEDYRRILVLMSDMIEDSERYNFDRLDLNEQLVETIVTDQRNKGLIPSLRGVEIFVTGASGRSATQAQKVERFWMRYAAEMNATLRDGRYSSTLLEFPE